MWEILPPPSPSPPPFPLSIDWIECPLFCLQIFIFFLLPAFVSLWPYPTLPKRPALHGDVVFCLSRSGRRDVYLYYIIFFIFLFCFRFFFYRSSSALNHRSSTEILSRLLGHFSVEGVPHVRFFVSGIAAGFEPTSLSLGGGCLNCYLILTPQNQI